MMTAIRALASKELQQHKGIFLGLLCFCGIATWMLFRITNAGGRVLSYLSITSVFAVSALIVIAFVIGQRLISAEYYGQTQRFIEALPIRRGYVQWVKYCIGLVSLMVLLGSVWLACLNAAQRVETITPTFMGLMALRLSAYLFAVWSTVFTLSLLGRLRIPLIASAALAVALINSFTQFEFSRFGPLALVDQQLFAFERAILPLNNLIETLIGGSLMLILGMWLANRRDGSLVETLATPLDTRAKGFLIALGVTTVGIYSYFGPEPEAAPFAFSDSYVVAEDPVEIAYLDPQFEGQAKNLLVYLAGLTQGLQPFVLNDSEEFLVRVSLAPVADPTEYSTEFSSPTEGIVVGANFDAGSGWDNALFGAYVVHQVLSARSNGRVMLEPHHWLLDGFSRWWAANPEGSVWTDDSGVDPVMLEALYVTRDRPISERLLREWDTSAEQLGETMAMSVAYSGWRILQEQQGVAAALALARQEFSRPIYGDARDWWRDWRDPLPERFTRATGWDWSDFIAAWDRRMAELRASPNYRGALDSIAVSELAITTEISEAGTRSLHYSLQLDRPLPADSKCTALHVQLRSFDYPVGRSGLRETPVFWPNSSLGAPAVSIDYLLEGEYGQGTRVFAAFECQFPQFPAPLQLGAVRLTMP
jgi:hypothetical protein